MCGCIEVDEREHRRRGRLLEQLHDVDPQMAEPAIAASDEPMRDRDELLSQLPRLGRKPHAVRRELGQLPLRQAVCNRSQPPRYVTAQLDLAADEVNEESS